MAYRNFLPAFRLPAFRASRSIGYNPFAAILYTVIGVYGSPVSIAEAVL